jgi:hypothetical protein
LKPAHEERIPITPFFNQSPVHTDFGYVPRFVPDCGNRIAPLILQPTKIRKGLECQSVRF